MMRRDGYALASLALVLGLSACSGDDHRGTLDGSVEVEDPDAREDVLDGVEPSETPLWDLSLDAPADGVEVDPRCEEPGGLFCPCASNLDCNSTICVPSRDGGDVCSQPCVETCPDGWSCRPVSLSGADTTFICVDSLVELCRPCTRQADCQLSGFTNIADRCVTFGEVEGAFCGVSCRPGEGSCPEGYVCDEVQSLGSEERTHQCVPEAGECACSGRAVLQRAETRCDNGPCQGTRICEEEGLSDCDAREPAEEICDGIDNNCSGLTDEGFPDTDGDGVADCVDPDIDGDGVLNEDDNCPTIPNPDQEDTRGNGVGDVCDPPEMPVLLGVTPPSPANHNTPVLHGTAPANHLVTLFTDPNCATAVTTATAAPDGPFDAGATVADNSVTTFWARAANRSGLTSPCSNTSVTYVEDSLPPAPPVFVATTPGSPSQTVTSPIVTGLAEAGAIVRLFTTPDCTGEPAATTETGQQGVFLASVTVGEGSTTTFRGTATDAAGNTSPCSPGAITYTHIAGPIDTFLTSGPSNPSTSTTATFWFISNVPDATFRCRLDDGPIEDCTSPRTYEALSEGAHRFEVAAVNADGVADPTPAIFEWSIDITPPQTTLTDLPPDPSNDPTPAIGFVVSDAGSSTVCRLGDGPFSPCTSPWITPHLSDGHHTIYLLSTDAAGNQEPVPASYRWRVDTVPPVTTLTPLGFGPLTNQRDLAFGLSSNEPGTFLCTLNGQPIACPTAPGRLDLAGLPDGEHVVVAAAVDEAGNVDPEPPSVTVVVDATPPNTFFIGELPPNLSSETAVSIAFGSDDPTATFECALAPRSFTPCASPWVSELEGGVWTFRVRAVDPAGNRDPDPATVTFGIDNVPPDTFFLETPPPLWNRTSATFRFASNALDVAGFLCWLNGEGPFECDSPHTEVDLAEGEHLFEVAAYDAVGNIDPTPAAWSFVVDSIPPDSPLGFAVTAGNRQVQARWDPVGDAASYALRYGPAGTVGALPSTATASGTSVTVTGLSNCVTYVFEVVAIDEAGNVSDPSPRLEATPELPTPESLVVGGDGLVSVRWTQVQNATGYRIRYGFTAGGPYDGALAFEGASPVDAGGQATELTLRGLPADVDVFIRVAALDGSCQSDVGPEHRSDPYPWDWLSPLPTGNALRAASCHDSGCVLVGQAGTVLHGPGPEGPWTRGNGGTAQPFVSVAHTGPSSVVAIAGSSVFLSTDGGATLREVFTVSAPLAKVASAGQVVWAVGQSGAILRSTDGGASWVAQASGTSGDLSALSVVSAEVAYAAGAGGTLLRTSDGQAWATVDGPVLERIRDLDCADAGTCWGVGDGGAIIRTSNGVTWTSVTPRPTSRSLVAVRRGGDGILRAAGAADTTLASADGGASWTLAGSGTAGAGDLFGLGATGPDGGALLVGEKGLLVHWRAASRDDLRVALHGGDLRAITAAPSGLLVVGQGGIHRLDLDSPSLTLAEASAGTVRAIDFGDGGFGMAVGDGGWARITQDGGQSWQAVDVGQSAELRAVSCVGGTTCWAGGASATIARTSDGGQSWVPRTGFGGTRALRFFGPLEGAMAIDNSFAGFSNYTGALWSVDGGTNWSSFLNYSNGRALLGDSVEDLIYVGGGGSNSCVEKAGLALQGGGETGVIWQRNAAGQWRAALTAAIDNRGDCFLAVGGERFGDIVAGGTQGLLARNVPAPFDWVQLPAPTRERDIFGMAVLSPSRVLAIGEAGMILVTDTGGL